VGRVEGSVFEYSSFFLGITSFVAFSGSSFFSVRGIFNLKFFDEIGE
jgi:hypothetical protein